MEFRHNISCTVGLLTMLAAPAAAQSTNPPKDSEEGTHIVVTGSRVVRDGFQAPTPITVISGDTLKQGAPTNISQVLNDLPAFGVGTTPRATDVGISSGKAGVNLVNLRNLGLNRTLVLFDGQRVVQSLVTGGVDLSTVPASLIERIDVVTGGASAANGSDAVGGVVNLVINKNFNGLELSAEGGISTRGDDPTYKIEGVWGSDFAGGRGHAIFGTTFTGTPEITRAKDRDWFEAVLLVENPAFAPGNGEPRLIHTTDNVGPGVATAGGLIVAGPLRGIQFLEGGTPAPFNFGQVNGFMSVFGDAEDAVAANTNLTAKFKSKTFFGHLRYDIFDNVTASLQLNYGDAEGENESFTYPRFGNINIAIDNAFLDPGIRDQMVAEGITSFRLGTTNTGLGYPGSRNRRRLYRGVFALNGTVGQNWNWEAYYQKGVVQVDTTLVRNPLTARYNMAIDAVRDPGTGAIVCRSTLTDPGNGCQPYNVMGVGVASQAAIDWILDEPMQDLRLKLDVVAASVNGDLFDLPAGPVAVAAGVEWRKESARTIHDPRANNNEFYSGNSLNFYGESTVKEGFAEILLPIAAGESWADSLDVNGAIRLTDYSTSGSVVTWKTGLVYAPVADLRLRGTLSRDIRAPSLLDLFNPASSGGGVRFDPFTNTTANVINTRVGNPDLDPEVADTISFGAVYSPSWLPGLTFSADYYDIKIKDAISTVDDPVQLCFEGQTQFCSQLVRDDNGVLVQTFLLPQNVDELRMKGLDFEAGYNTNLGKGNLSLRLLGSYVFSKTQFQNGIEYETAGSIGSDFPVSISGISVGVPKLRINLNATYSQGPASVSLQSRFIGSAFNNKLWDEGEVDDNTIPAIAYFDLRSSYEIGAFTVFGAIDNVLDKDPPVVAPSFNYRASFAHLGTNQFIYDTLGRRFRFGVRAKF